jgi:hypothetical protein
VDAPFGTAVALVEIVLAARNVPDRAHRSTR